MALKEAVKEPQAVGRGVILQVAFALGFLGIVMISGYGMGNAGGSAKEQFVGALQAAKEEATARSAQAAKYGQAFLPQKKEKAVHIHPELARRLEEMLENEESRQISSLNLETLSDHQLATSKLHKELQAGLEALGKGLSSSRHGRLHRLFELLGQADTLVQQTIQQLMPTAAKRMSTESRSVREADILKNQDRAPKTGIWKIAVTVSELPFGMHVRRGTARVAEVFPGSPAQKAGVRKDCEVSEISGKHVEAGTWLEEFQSAVLPFPLRLTCGKTVDEKFAGTGPLSVDSKRYKVMVVKKPFGMNVQVNVVPRVVEVLPGFPAEAAGVRRGFVLTEVNDQPVDTSNWFEKYQSATLPFTLTFNTAMPLHAGNPFFLADTDGKDPTAPAVVDVDATKLEPLPEGDPMGDSFADFHVTVANMPFGMQVSAVPRKWPRVVLVPSGLLAEKAGVRVGDVLIEVAGRPVTATTWFAAMQQAVAPYGLRFRRHQAQLFVPSQPMA